MKKKQPNFPVWVALEYLGVSDVPHVHGDGYVWMLCPFHPDSKPSAHISRLGFHCFSCEASGDAVKLLRTEGGMDYKAALSICEERTGSADTSSAPQRPPGASLLD